MTTIGVSILNFQAAKETLACVESLLRAGRSAQLEIALRVEVADNHSDGPDFECLAAGLEGMDGVSLHRHEGNLGFAAGHNRNIDRLFAGDTPDFIWLLNNDCEVEPRALRALLDCARSRPEVGIWGATLLEARDGPLQCAGGCTYRAWLSAHRSIGEGAPLERLGELPEPHLDYVAGASLFMPAATLLEGLKPPRCLAGKPKSRWLNEEYFLYFEELDLAHRLRDGVQMAWCRNARIVHSGGSGTGSGASRRSPGGEYHSTLSALKFTRLYLPGQFWLAAPSRLLVKSFVNLLTLRFDLLRALFRAYRDYFAWRQAAHEVNQQ